MQKQLFYTVDSTEFEKYFFEDTLLDFPKYLAFLQTYLESKGRIQSNLYKPLSIWNLKMGKRKMY